MCILIYCQQGKLLTIDAFKASIRHNQDGFGYAWRVATNQLECKKFLIKNLSDSNLLQYYNRYCKDVAGSDHVFHARLCTHGTVSRGNIHPFKTANDEFIAHNGVLNVRQDGIPKNWSDTRYWVDAIINQIGDGPTSTQLQAINDFVTRSRSKVIWFKKDTVYLFNQEAGHWSDGIWYSNNSYKVNTYATRKKQKPSSIYLYDLLYPND